MPPGAWHTVYTPVGGMTSGGHFLAYDTMHLTYLSRSYDMSKYPGTDERRSEHATNESQSIDRQILRMVLALKFAVQAPSTFEYYIIIIMF
jgi:hypothetical protein